MFFVKEQSDQRCFFNLREATENKHETGNLEKKKFKMELFLRNISDEDRKILTKISFIRSFKLTYLLFKLLDNIPSLDH